MGRRHRGVIESHFMSAVCDTLLSKGCHRFTLIVQMELRLVLNAWYAIVQTHSGPLLQVWLSSFTNNCMVERINADLLGIKK